MKGRIVVAFLFVVLASAGVALLGGMLAGEPRKSCCSERDIMVRGAYAAVDELPPGHTARLILEEALYYVGAEKDE